MPDGGLSFTAKDAFIDTGTVFTDELPAPGGVTIGAGRTLGIREGFSLNRSLTNHGTLAPGLELGSITVQSNYFQYSDGTSPSNLVVQRRTRITIDSSPLVRAFLAGNLKVSFVSGYTPAGGNTFTVLTAARSPALSIHIDLPQLTAGLVWNVSQTSTAFTLTVVAGDYNQNGIVDTADYVMWRNARIRLATPYSGADGNGDGVVNDADFSVWRNNLGKIRVELLSVPVREAA